MNNTIKNLIVATALSFSAIALAAEETESPARPSGTEAASAVSPAEAMPEKTEEQAQPVRSPTPVRSEGERPKNLDLRHCLELGSNEAIAKCAGETGE